MSTSCFIQPPAFLNYSATAMPESPDVFISFSFANRPLAEAADAALRALGVSTWLCTADLRAGNTFDA